MKKIATLMFLTIFTLASTFGIAQAGSRRHDRFVEGAIIGAGAAIIGTAIINDINRPVEKHIYLHDRRDRYDRNDRYDRHRRHDRDHDSYRREYRDRDYRPSRGGYWSVERVWVEPVYGRRWNPGHYNRRGYWVPGGYDRVIVREGYWDTKRIWVSN